MTRSNDLAKKRCKACDGETEALSDKEVQNMLTQLDGWELAEGFIEKTFKFIDYKDVMAFVNATAWISHSEDHHPDIELTYNRCVVRYTTHAIGGLSENDFICAAKVEALFN